MYIFLIQKNVNISRHDLKYGISGSILIYLSKKGFSQKPEVMMYDLMNSMVRPSTINYLFSFV